MTDVEQIELWITNLDQQEKELKLQLINLSEQCIELCHKRIKLFKKLQILQKEV